jgi:hypothetical protein
LVSQRFQFRQSSAGAAILRPRSVATSRHATTPRFGNVRLGNEARSPNRCH